VHFTKNHATFLLSCPTVLTVNDLNRLHYPAMFSRIDVLYWKTIQPILLRHMTKVIAISKNTQRDLQHFYQLPDERIQVIYPAISPRFQRRETLGPRRVSEVLNKYAIRPPYVLSVGGMAVHKNVYTALSAFYTLLERGYLVDHSFVMVGDRVHTHNDRRLFELAEQHHGKNVHFTGLVDDEDLPVLYAGADLFVYPSLYEGFGLSPLEAMACGVPVLASMAGSLVEVLADSAWLVERATDVEAVAEGMRAILTDRETWEDFRERGFKNVSRFSWRETARQTLALYRQIV
jgi:glycosyltransferase involved in cell wall biosynthesis